MVRWRKDENAPTRQEGTRWVLTRVRAFLSSLAFGRFGLFSPTWRNGIYRDGFFFLFVTSSVYEVLRFYIHINVNNRVNDLISIW